MSFCQTVSLNISRYIYDILRTFFIGADTNGGKNNALVLKSYYKYYSKDGFRGLSFENFLKGPQDRESLIELLEDVHNNYTKFTYNKNIFDQMIMSNQDNDIIQLKIDNKILKSDFDEKESSLISLNKRFNNTRKEYEILLEKYNHLSRNHNLLKEDYVKINDENRVYRELMTNYNQKMQIIRDLL